MLAQKLSILVWIFLHDRQNLGPFKERNPSSVILLMSCFLTFPGGYGTWWFYWSKSCFHSINKQDFKYTSLLISSAYSLYSFITPKFPNKPFFIQAFINVYLLTSLTKTWPKNWTSLPLYQTLYQDILKLLLQQMDHLTYPLCQTKENMSARLENCIFPESLAAAKCPSFPLATVAPKCPWHENALSRKPYVTCSPKGQLLPTSQKCFHSASPREILSLGLLMPLLSQLGGPCG